MAMAISPDGILVLGIVAGAILGLLLSMLRK